MSTRIGRLLAAIAIVGFVVLGTTGVASAAESKADLREECIKKLEKG
jgi:hypothetical protein